MTPCFCGGCRTCLHDMGDDCGEPECRQCVELRREEAEERERRAAEIREEQEAVGQEMADELEPCPYCKHDCAGQCQDQDVTEFVNVRGVVTFGDQAEVSER